MGKPGYSSLAVILCYLILHYCIILAPFPGLSTVQLLIASIFVLQLDDGMTWETGHHYVTIASLCNVALSSIASHSKGSEEEEEENGEKKKVPKPGDVVNLVSHCTQTDLTV